MIGAKRALRRTPLDAWIEARTGGDLARWQLDKLNETLRTAQNSLYYRDRLPASLPSLDAIADLPTIDASTLTKHANRLLCVPQQEVSRVVTLQSSGTTGLPKRISFTEADQELTLDFFAHGLFTIADPGQRMAILLPCEREGGVGDLIARALARMNVTPIRFGLVGSLETAARMLSEQNVQALVGVPVQVRALALFMQATQIPSHVQRVLLSTDNVPLSTMATIRNAWNCEVYNHYGMTEMGLGGAIDCDAHDGAHIRENDLLIEILNEGSRPLPDGEWGEVAFTTLTRRAMPFIRYRTGDIARVLLGACACGSTCRRLSPILRRKDALVSLANGATLDITAWDEALFALPQLSDYAIEATPALSAVSLTVEAQRSTGTLPKNAVAEALAEAGLLGGIDLSIKRTHAPDTLTLHRGEKRSVHVAHAPT